MKYYIPKYLIPAGPLVNKLIEDEESFNEYTKFKETLPDNLRFGNPNDFNMYRYWELNGKPKNFEEGLNRKMFTFDNKDKKYHANSVAYNKDNNTYEIMKSKNHPTLDLEFLNYANNNEFRKKYKYDGESHSYVRRTEPYSPYIKDYPKPKKVESFKPNNEYKPFEYNPFIKEIKKVWGREIDNDELKQKIKQNISGPEKTWYEKWNATSGAKALDAADLALDVATIAYPPVGIITAPLGSLISIPQGVLGAIDALQNGLSLQNTADMISVIPMGSWLKLEANLLAKNAKKNTKVVRYASPYINLGKKPIKTINAFELIKKDPRYLNYFIPKYTQDALALTGSIIGVTQ